MDILEQFWATATWEEIALDNGETKIMVTCAIGGTSVSFDEMDVNKALGLAYENFDKEASEEQLRDFLEFIHYSSTLELGKINKKFIRKEWSFVYDTIIRVFSCRKTGFDRSNGLVTEFPPL
ncbi:hypothetical protein ACR2XN_28605 [Klebsiella pneumoniae]